MGPEEFFHRSRLIDENEIFEMRVRSLSWMMDCYQKGTIRSKEWCTAIEHSIVLFIWKGTDCNTWTEEIWRGIKLIISTTFKKLLLELYTQIDR